MAFFSFCFNIPVVLLVFLASALPMLVFYIYRALRRHMQRIQQLHRCLGCVPATVVQVDVDTPTWRDGWVVTAAWMDTETRQTYTFHSTPQEFRPKKRAGDKVFVFINSLHPMHYSMEL